jgi:hypothetical protein
MAEKALAAANAQHTVLPTQATGSALVLRLAGQINAIDAEIADVDKQIMVSFQQHADAEILQSMPGFGPVLAATFLPTPAGTWTGSTPPTGSPASPAWPRPPKTQTASPATTTDPTATTAGSCAPAISPLSPV